MRDLAKIQRNTNTPCLASHDKRHRPIQKLGSDGGYICKCCRKEIYRWSEEQLDDFLQKLKESYE